MLDHRVLLAYKDIREHLVLKVLTVIKVQLEHKVMMAYKA